MSPGARRIGWLLVMSAAVAVPVGALIDHARWDGFAIHALVAFAHAIAIGVPIVVIFERIKPRLDGHAGLGPWLSYVGVLLVATVLGTAVVRGGLVAVGAMPIADLWRGVLGSLAISLAIAAPMTVGAVTYGRLTRQLSTQALEAQRALTLAGEARLASLESRIRPHFLFNALNSAVALIADDPRRAEDVLVRLGALLRTSLDRRASLVSLADELAMVTDYLEIERARFGERLAYALDVGPALGERLVPAFAVQTLVENAVKHAVAARADGARIAVGAHVDGDRLIVDVTDDGPGFARTPWQVGHGLDGLRARLAALYGAAAQLQVDELRASGAAVTMCVPAGAR